MACWTHLEGFQVVSSHFWALLCTGLTGLALLQHRLRFFGLVFVAQPSNPVIFW
jgi:hypothetical protein